MMAMDLNKEAGIDTTWLSVANYKFKILVMISCLAQNHLAFRGKLKDMCDFLGVGNTTSNTKKIKEAIQQLEEKGDIIKVQEGYTYTLTLTNKAYNKAKVKRIRNAWVSAIQGYEPEDKHNSVSWETVLKVLVYLMADKRENVRYDEIGKDLGIEKDTVRKAVKALQIIQFEDIILKKKLNWLRLHDGSFKEEKYKYQVIGQKIDVVLNFE